MEQLYLKMKSNLIVSVEEARIILGTKADSMSDDEVAFTIETLDLMAKDALQLSKEQLLRKRDAKRIAELIYDIHIDKKVFKK